MVRTTSPGDLVEVTGIFLSRPANKGDKLIQKTYLVASKIQKLKENYSKLLTSEDDKFINEVRQDKNMLKKIIKSLAPEIWGMDMVKKALLL